MKFFKRLSVRYQLLIITVSTIIVMSSIIFITYLQTAETINKKSYEYTKNIIFQIKQSITSNVDGLNRIITNIAYNTTIQDYMMETDQVKRFELYHKVDNFLNNIKDIKGGIMDIIIVGDGGNSFDLNGQINTVPSIEEALPARSKAYFSGVRYYEYSQQQKSCFVVANAVYSINPNNLPGEKIGTVYIIIEAQSISPQIKNLSVEEDVSFYLLDHYNKFFYSNVKSEMGKEIEKNINNLKESDKPGILKVNGKKEIVLLESIPEIGGKIVSVVSEQQLLADLKWIQRIVAIIFLVAIILLSFQVALISNNIIQPLNKLITFIALIKSGNLKKRINVDAYAEMNVLIQEFNSMLDEIDHLTIKLVESNTMLYQLELKKKQSELAFLQSQINPHFLYNTLETIKGIAAVKGVNEIKDMTKALAQVFRYSVKGEDTVALREELNISKSYIRIQMIRFRDRFSVEYEFSPEVLEYKVPKMILQPIIENAIFHGLEPKLIGGNLLISGEFTEHGNVIIKVNDDGVGMDNDKVGIIQKELAQGQDAGPYIDADKATIGLINVHNRIRLIYGESYGISISSHVGAGTEVILKMPGEGDMQSV